MSGDQILLQDLQILITSLQVDMRFQSKTYEGHKKSVCIYHEQLLTLPNRFSHL